MADQGVTTPHDLVCSIQASIAIVEDNVNLTNVLVKDNQANAETIEKLQSDNRENLRCMESMHEQTEKEIQVVKDKLDEVKKLLERDAAFSLANVLASSFRPGYSRAEVPPSQESMPMTNVLMSGSSIHPEELILPSSAPAWLDTESPEARAAIRSTNSPLAPQVLKKFLDRVKQRKNPHAIAHSYTNRIPNLVCQLRQVLSHLQEAQPITQPPDKRLEMRLTTLITNLLRYLQSPAAAEYRADIRRYMASPMRSSSTVVEDDAAASPVTSSTAAESLQTASSPDAAALRARMQQTTPKKVPFKIETIE